MSLHAIAVVANGTSIYLDSPFTEVTIELVVPQWGQSRSSVLAPWRLGHSCKLRLTLTTTRPFLQLFEYAVRIAISSKALSRSNLARRSWNFKIWNPSCYSEPSESRQSREDSSRGFLSRERQGTFRPHQSPRDRSLGSGQQGSREKVERAVHGGSQLKIGRERARSRFVEGLNDGSETQV
jgi:hypothetical protein